MLQRGKMTEELLQKPDCFTLLTQIALRAKRSDDFNLHNLKIGESFIGDYQRAGLTEQRYRTAKNNLAKWGFATFKATNKGTVAKLTDTRVYDINENEINGQANEQLTDKPTDEQRTTNEQPTTKKNYKNIIIKEDKNIIDTQFEEFWNLYNYKKGKPKALVAYKICIKKTTHEQILEGVKKYNSNKGTESKYWKHPKTWLNAESWNDEYSTESKPLEVKSQKEIWTEKILKSNKPADYEEVMKVANFEADYKYFENDKFYFLAENEAIKTKCKERVKEIELELFKLKNNQCQVFIISKNYFDGK